LGGRRRDHVIHHHLDLAFLRVQDNRLLAQPPDRVERTLRLTPQRQLLHVLGNATFDHGPQFFGHGKELICRIEAFERLVRSFVVVILHPQPNPLPCLVEAVELGATEKLLPDRLPEPLHFAQRHRVMRLALEVMDPVFLQLLLEPGLAPPRDVLPAIVGEHLLGHTVFADRRAIHFQDMCRTLAAKQIQPHHVARVVIQKRNQVGILPAQPEREDVALPHLIWGGPLEEARLGRVLRHFLLRLGQQPMLVQRPPHRFRAAGQKQHPP